VFEATLKLQHAGVVGCFTTMIGSEDDSGNAFEDVEVMIEIWVLKQQAVDGMCSEVDGATVRISFLALQNLAS
jgi:hypothetical protein